MKKTLGLIILIIGLIYNCTSSLQSYQKPNKTYDTSLCKKERPEYSNIELKSLISTNGIAFPTASSEVLEISYKKLDSIFNIIMNYNETFIFEISVHSDKVGDESINCKLSMERANAIRDYLLKKGIRPESIVAQGYGSNYPVSNRTAKNRRIEINLLKKKLKNIIENSNKKKFAFKAKVQEIKIVQIGECPFTPCYTYKWEDFLNRKKHCLIITGFDSNHLVSMVLKEVIGEGNPLNVGDSIDFIVHSPAKLGIHSDSLPEMHSFELIADLNDSTKVIFDLYPTFKKE